MSAHSDLHVALNQLTQLSNRELLSRLFDQYYLEKSRSHDTSSTTQDDKRLFGYLECLDEIKHLLTTEHQDTVILGVSEDRAI
jgi:hypothetical protein